MSSILVHVSSYSFFCAFLLFVFEKKIAVPGPPSRIKSLDPSSNNSSRPVTVSPMQAPSMTVTQRPVRARSKSTIDVLL